jgi:nuclear protein localization family protein 4
MNFPEMNQFVNEWIKTGVCRMAWLYGYYSEDPNYPEGVRVNVEAIYEPLQEGEMNAVIPLNDPYQQKVDRIAASLGFEKVGWIFTSMTQDMFLTQ